MAMNMTNVVMSSGKKYQIDMHTADFIKVVSDNDVLLNKLVHFDVASINPQQIASIEQYDSQGVTVISKPPFM